MFDFFFTPQVHFTAAGLNSSGLRNLSRFDVFTQRSASYSDFLSGLVRGVCRQSLLSINDCIGNVK